MLKYAIKVKTADEKEKDYWVENDRMIEILDGLKEREKRTLERKIKAGEIDYDPKIDKLFYTNTKEEIVLGELSDGSSDSNDSDQWNN